MLFRSSFTGVSGVAGCLLYWSRTEEPRPLDNQHQILVVTPLATRGKDLRTWLGAAGYWVTVSSCFATAKLQLQANPAVLITDLKLGEYNGLHLAVRAQAGNVPTLVMSDPDGGVEREVDRLGAFYLSTKELSRERVLAFVESRLPRANTGGPSWLEQNAGTPLAADVKESTPVVLVSVADRRLTH